MANNIDAREAARQAYQSSLVDLTRNDRNLILSLTEIARENERWASTIVDVIESQIRNAPSAQKLPVLYLLDSIVKNLGGVFVLEFSRNIVKTFAQAYDSVSWEDRARMAKLVESWKVPPPPHSSSIFASIFLSQMEDKIRSSQPYAGQSTFGLGTLPIQQAQQRQTHNMFPIQMQPPAPGLPPMSGSIFGGSQPSMLPQLLPQLPHQTDLTRQLVLNTLVSEAQTVIAQKRSKLIMNPMNPIVPGEIELLQQVLTSVATQHIELTMLQQLLDQVRQMKEAPPLVVVPPPSLPPPPAPVVVPPTFTMPPSLSSLGTPASWTSILNKTSSAGLVPPPPTTTGASTTPDKKIMRMQDLPRILLNNDDINRRIDGAVALLYDAIPTQCKQCGRRFMSTEEGKEQNSAHLDWHFRASRRQREKARKAVSRDWYLPENEWCIEKEADIKDKQVQSSFFNSMEAELTPDKEMSEEGQNVPLENGASACPICNESFEKFFDQEREEWMFKNAIKLEHKARIDYSRMRSIRPFRLVLPIYHFTCYRDHTRPRAKMSTPPRSPGDTTSLGKHREGEDESVERKRLRI
ncbi:hypothetical protein SmJEL517_g00862 [Synchytrium microbalum]|uniref:CID domain-containing protein n=1 Tax=Synchytrium microbalum TaxID=1806994 RepID=A0A507CCI8_9FUNG|nr:uncharacterized protein SmJEL517_g00862 [Synchytrium microbalum]TPX37058.1 hypothetical protein SmJEL517_g00862 [Synchytrium microbalum]